MPKQRSMTYANRLLRSRVALLLLFTSWLFAGISFLWVSHTSDLWQGVVIAIGALALLLICIRVNPKKEFIVLYLRGFSGRPNDTLKRAFQDYVLRFHGIVAIYNRRSNPTFSGSSRIFSLLLISPIAAPLVLVSAALGGTGPALLLVVVIWFATNKLLTRVFTHSIYSDRTIEKFLARLRRIKESRQIPAGTLMARSTIETWRSLVVGCCTFVDKIVIDLTYPGPGLIWEIEYCIRTYPRKVIFVSSVDLDSNWISRHGDAAEYISTLVGPYRVHVCKDRMLFTGVHAHRFARLLCIEIEA